MCCRVYIVEVAVRPDVTECIDECMPCINLSYMYIALGSNKHRNNLCPECCSAFIGIPICIKMLHKVVDSLLVDRWWCHFLHRSLSILMSFWDINECMQNGLMNRNSKIIQFRCQIYVVHCMINKYVLEYKPMSWMCAEVKCIHGIPIIFVWEKFWH